MFVFLFLSMDAAERRPALPFNPLCETLWLFAPRRYFPFDGEEARVALDAAAAFFWVLSCASRFLALSFDFGDLSPMESTSCVGAGRPSANGSGYHLRGPAPAECREHLVVPRVLADSQTRVAIVSIDERLRGGAAGA
jgi:hypothetical protein